MANADSTVVQFKALTPIDRIRKLVRDDVEHDKQSIRAGIAARSYSWGWSVEGLPTVLIGAGIADASWFATGLDRMKGGRAIRTKVVTVDGREIKTSICKPSKTGKPRPARVHIHRTTSERDEYDAINGERLAAKRRQQAEVATAEAWARQRQELLAKETAQTVGEWRAAIVLTITALPPTNVLSGWGHKRMCDEDLQKVDELWEQLLSVVRGCRVIVASAEPRPRLTVVK